MTLESYFDQLKDEDLARPDAHISESRPEGESCWHIQATPLLDPFELSTSKHRARPGRR